MIDRSCCKSELQEISKCVNKETYTMYQDMPSNELGISNKFHGASYDEFVRLIEKAIKEEIEINSNLNSTTKRYIFYVNKVPIGELGIRTTLNDFWINKGSQIFYKIRYSQRNKGYGTEMLRLGIEECKKLGFKTIRINCDNTNIASKKIILRNGGIADIKDYKTNDGISTSYLIRLVE